MTPGRTKTERRKSPRRSVGLDSSVTYKALPTTNAHIINIGFAGAMLALPLAAPPVHARVRLIIALPGGKSPITLEAKVVHRSQGKFGVKFVDLNRALYSELVDVLFRWQDRSVAVKTNTYPESPEMMLFRRA